MAIKYLLQMITKLKIANFKSHENTELTLGSLTLLTGVNGCGKTSIVQSLLLLRQTHLKGRLDSGLDLNKSLCSIGVANDALYRNAKNGYILFEFMSDNEIYSLKFDAGSNLDSSFIPKASYSENVTNDKLAKIALFNNNFQYISAARWGGVSNFPKDSYTVETQKQISSENGQGELVAQFLHKFGGDPIAGYTKESKNLSLIEQVKLWEQKISPNVTINVEKGSDETSFKIKYGYEGVDNNKPLENLRAENIGFGISYSLPVIVALLSAPPGALIIIENPEAHLHPDGQAQLAKLIALVAQNEVQVIVETHSDHIINGILIACKKQETGHVGIDRNFVSVYYMGNKDHRHNAVVDKIQILENGVIEHQPEGFFDRDEKDAFYLSGFDYE